MAGTPERRYSVRLVDGTVLRSLEKAAVRSMAAAGRLGPTDALSVDGENHWVELAKVPGLLPTAARFAAVTVVADDGTIAVEGTPAAGPAASLSTNSSPPTPKRPSAQAPAIHPNADARPKQLAKAGIVVAVLVVIATTVWFFQDQYRSAKSTQASKEVQAAIEQVEALPTSAATSDVVRQIETVLVTAQSQRSLADRAVIERAESLRPRLDAARAKLQSEEAARQLESDVAALKADLENAKLPRIEIVVASGLRASNPAAAQKLIDELEAADEEHIHSAYSPKFFRYLRDGEMESAEQWVSGVFSTQEISLADYRRWLNIFARLGKPEHERRLSDAEFIEKCDQLRKTFISRLQAIEATAVAALHYDEQQCKKALKPAREAMSAFDERCQVAIHQAGLAAKIQAECVAMDQTRFKDISDISMLLKEALRKGIDEGSETWQNMTKPWDAMSAVFEVFRQNHPKMTKDNVSSFIEGVSEARKRRGEP